MVQGAVKKSKAPVKTRPKTIQPQKGTRVIKPKKAALIKQLALKKKHSSGLTGMTEASLAGKAGHLEILRGGKKDGTKNSRGKDLKAPLVRK